MGLTFGAWLAQPGRSGGPLMGRRRPGPRQEFVETRLRPEIDEPGEYVDEIRLRIDAVQFAGLDQRREAGPVLSSAVMTGEQCILSIMQRST